MQAFVSNALGRLQRAAGRSRLATRLAIKTKNQCDMVIGQCLGGSHLLPESGEQWLTDLVAPHVRFFVDVGANVGAWTLAVARRMPHPPAGLAFEPNPGTAGHLRAALQAAGLTGCEVIEAAASDRNGQARFFAEAHDGHTSGFYPSALPPAGENVDVKLCRLDDELARRGIKAVDALKIDAEGHDFYVMLGAASAIAARQIQLIQFEYNQTWVDAGATLTRAIAYLEANGYQVRLLRAGGLYRFDVRMTGEFFKYSNFVAYVPGAFGGLLDRLPCPPIL